MAARDPAAPFPSGDARHHRLSAAAGWAAADSDLFAASRVPAEASTMIDATIHSYSEPLARSPYSLIQIHPDALHLRVVLERVHAHLAAEAALLVTAERRGRVVDIVRVDPDGPRLELARHIVR